MPVEKLSDTLNKNNYSNNSNKVIKNISNNSNYSNYISREVSEFLVEEGLVILGNSDFKPYLFSTLFKIGREKFLEAMNAARRSGAKCMACYFAKTLKNMRDSVDNGLR